MANELKLIKQNKLVEKCNCPLEVRYVLQRNNESLEEETNFEPTDDAVYKIVVTNKGNGYAKDVKAFTWLTASTPPGETIDLPDDLRIIPHGLLGQFKLNTRSDPGAIKFPNDLHPVPSDLDLKEFRENAHKHLPNIPFPKDDDNNRLLYRCNVIRLGDIPSGQTKVACLAIISEGAPEKTIYKINFFFKFDCCKLVEVPVPLCRQVEHGVIKGQIGQD